MMSKSQIRKLLRNTVAGTLVAVTVFVLTSCSLSSGDVENTSITEEEKTFVITTEGHTGVEKLYDELKWRDEAMCAVAYIGTKSDWKSGADDVYREYFSHLPHDVFDDLELYDAGGNDVFLFIPRFDQEKISVYLTRTNNENKTEITDLLLSGNKPFYLICDNSKKHEGAKVDVLIPNVIKRTIAPIRSMFDGTVNDADGFQDITPKRLHFDKPHTTANEESQTN